MAKKFDLLNSFLGYSNKADITNIDSRYLVPGSQNVFINSAEKVAIRAGYTLDGQANTALTPIISSYDWNTSTGTEQNLRSYNAELEYRYVSSTGTVTWRRLANGFGSSVAFNFAEFYDITTEKKDLLIMVNGTANAYMWSGAVTTIASVGVNTLTKAGTNTWAQDRFLVGGTRTVIILGVTYTYTAGEGTTTLTGVTPNPAVAAPAIASGDIVHQGLRTTSNIIASTYYPGIIGVVNNYIWYADLARRDVYVSKNTDYTSFTFTAPTRLPGEGALLTYDSNPVGFEVQEENIYVFGSKNDVYQNVFTRSADLTKEEIIIKRLNSGPGQGALSQGAIGKIKNSIVYVTDELTIDTLGRIENINTTQSKPLSDIVQDEFKNYDYTIGPHIKYFQDRTHIMVPSESSMMIFDHAKGLWFPPQILPGRRIAIIDGDLYLHSNSVPETYKIFVGTSDNTNPINAIASFAYNSYGRRDHTKTFSEWLTEGYVSSNAIIKCGLKYDFGGFTSIIEKDIDGSDTAIIFSTTTDNSFGKNPIGSQPLGSITDSPSNLSKFRIINEITRNALDFYELQVFYQTNTVDAQWELLAFGGDVDLSKNDNNSIKQ